MPKLVMRRDLIWMGSIAAFAGIALAVLLTASFGARSSGPPAALRPQSPAPSTAGAKARVSESAAPRRSPPRKRRRHHRRHVPVAKPAPPTPALAQAQPPATQTQSVVDSQPTQTVASPTPAPKPVRPLSRPAPKRSSPGGDTFDDSG